ncbi:jg5805 [Pararge aegeria aegeria]|uniref:Jg5805 protein n=1 Tax=Pararge aegeria aegeria TaxID=348720 RepID=A0A8S4R6E6_9NEOP|nr:jg5805 [Pararge aegeria aegeria]
MPLEQGCPTWVRRRPGAEREALLRARPGKFYRIDAMLCPGLKGYTPKLQIDGRRQDVFLACPMKCVKGDGLTLPVPPVCAKFKKRQSFHMVRIEMLT